MITKHKKLTKKQLNKVSGGVQIVNKSYLGGKVKFHSPLAGKKTTGGTTTTGAVGVLKIGDEPIKHVAVKQVTNGGVTSTTIDGRKEKITITKDTK